jgi:uncharacterized membrane protein
MPLAYAVILGLLVGLTGHALLLSGRALAFSLPGGWDANLCNATGLCVVSANIGFLDLTNFISLRVIPITLTAFTGVVLLYFTASGFLIIIKAHDESNITEQKRMFTHGAIGLAVVGTARLIHATVAPAVVGSTLVNVNPFEIGLTRVSYFIFLILGAVLILLLTIAGIRLILSQGNESEVEKQKKYFFHALLGVVAVLLAGPIVVALVPGGTGATGIIKEAGGIARFILQIFAAFAVIAMIASGIIYATSIHNEERKERAKRLFVATIVATLLVVASYALIIVFA